MSEKYAPLRAALPELIAEASLQGATNPRAQLILNLLSDYDSLSAALTSSPIAWQSRFISSGDAWDAWQPCSKEHHELVTRTPSEWPGYETRAVCTYPAHLVRPDASNAVQPFTLQQLQKPVTQLLEFIFDRYRSPEAAEMLPDEVVAAVRELEPFTVAELTNQPPVNVHPSN